ncbi:MAG: hypothetical protein JWR69_4771 [Pedosphaera sp.]|nr:hypothetical protein [Pedosphaera sp.]
MNPYYRISLMVCRLTAAGFVLVSVLNLALYWVKSRHDGTAITPGHCAYLSIPLVIGVLILVKSSGLAHRLAQYLDE